MILNFKLFLSIIASIVGIVGYFPYVRDIFSHKTKTHLYTWLIWLTTTSTAMFGVIYGGGGWGALSLGAYAVLILGIFIFSFKYGTKNISKSDTAILVLALIAVIFWWQFKQPLVSVLIVTLIDFFGYVPSFRKTFMSPWSETPVSWLLFAISNLFTIFALKEYNLLTTTYLAVIMCANLAMFLISHLRRRYVPSKIE